MIIDLSIHSFPLWHHFAHQPGFDAVAFARLARSRGFSGINLSLNNENFRHLGGRETWRRQALRDELGTTGMSLEVDTSGTEPGHMRGMIGVAAEMGATHLRTYTRHSGSPAEMAAATISDLAMVTQAAEAAGVTIVLENHEDFTGPELAAIVRAVDHPRLRILYDYGNSQMVLEDPEEALAAVLPFVASVHVKDHVMVRPGHAGRLTVAGVPLGDGLLPIRRLTSRLLDAGLRRFCFESVWAYTAPIRAGRQPIGGAKLGEGSFRYAGRPFDPSHLILDQSRHSGAELVALEAQALTRGVAFMRAELAALGAEVRQLPG